MCKPRNTITPLMPKKGMLLIRVAAGKEADVWIFM